MQGCNAFISSGAVSSLASVGEGLVLSVSFVPVPANRTAGRISGMLLNVRASGTGCGHGRMRGGGFNTAGCSLRRHRNRVLRVGGSVHGHSRELCRALVAVIVATSAGRRLSGIARAIFTGISSDDAGRFTALHCRRLSNLGAILPFNAGGVGYFEALAARSLTTFVPFGTRRVRRGRKACCKRGTVDGGVVFVGHGGLLGNGYVILNMSNNNGSFFIGRSVASVFLSSRGTSVLVVSPRQRCRPLIAALNNRIVRVSTGSRGRVGTVSVGTGCRSSGGPVTAGTRFVVSLYRRLVNRAMSTGSGSVVSHYYYGICSRCVGDKCGVTPPALRSFERRLLERGRIRTGRLTLTVRLFAGNSLSAFTGPAGISAGGELVYCSVLRLNSRLLPINVLIMLSGVLGEVASGEEGNGAACVFVSRVCVLLTRGCSTRFLCQM